MPRRALCLILAVTLALAACTRPPALGGPVADADRRAPYPRLLPLQTVLAGLPGGDPAAEAPDLSARIAALRARAGGLRGPIIPASTRGRMTRGVDTGALR